jgi:hypothetical protein
MYSREIVHARGKLEVGERDWAAASQLGSGSVKRFG